MDDFDDDIVAEFLVESYENLDQLDQELLALEHEPGSHALLASVFRTVHTIKGTCGFLGFAHLESLAHVGENLLARLRDGELVLTTDMASTLFEMSDAIRRMLSSIAEIGTDGDDAHEPLARRLEQLAAGEAAPAPAPAAAAPAPAADEPVDGLRSVADTTVRVDVALLDNLVTLVGELVLTRNQIVQRLEGTDDPVLAATSARLNLITSELQEDAMKTRMQPIGSLWSKFPRIVRELSIVCNRKVRLETEGEDTELDKSILEAIRDPLTHLVRNAVDHGIEPPEDRRAAGKPEEGLLRIRALHDGGQVLVEVSDDGSGIDVERVRSRAVERGLLTAEQAAGAADHELVDLLFAPGFSTSVSVTHVSGRGVGMDVVRTNLERIGGSVEMASVPGQGTTCRVKIPLTLAIIPALVVGSEGSRYAIPQSNLLELVRLEHPSGPGGVEYIHGAPVHRLRGDLLPLVDLAQELGTEPVLRRDGPVTIVVLHADGRQFGLVVASIHDSAEIVVKPLGQHLRSIPVYAGSTIMGDGRVGLILDVMGLAQLARVMGEHRDRPSHSVAEAERDAEIQPMLLCASPDDGRLVIPLGLVDRLEEVAWTSVELVGDREVIQYRDEIVPLVHVSDVLPERRQRARHPESHLVAEELQVVIHSVAGRRIGLVVDSVIDVVEQDLRLAPGSRPGILGTAVVQGRVAEVLDVAAVLEMAGLSPADAVGAVEGAP